MGLSDFKTLISDNFWFIFIKAFSKKKRKTIYLFFTFPILRENTTNVENITKDLTFKQFTNFTLLFPSKFIQIDSLSNAITDLETVKLMCVLGGGNTFKNPRHSGIRRENIE